MGGGTGRAVRMSNRAATWDAHVSQWSAARPDAGPMARMAWTEVGGDHSVGPALENAVALVAWTSSRARYAGGGWDGPEGAATEALDSSSVIRPFLFWSW